MTSADIPGSSDASLTPSNNPPYRKPFIITSISTVFFLMTSVYLLLNNKLTILTPVDSQITTQNVTPTLTRIAYTHFRLEECTKNQCLFSGFEAPEGFAYLTGYYKSYKADDWGTPTTCNGFVVTGGNQILIDHFNDWINKGNGLNKRIDGNLVINLTLNKTNEKSIKSSNANDQIKLGMIRVSPRGTGTSTCTPVVEIITVEPAPTSTN
jgi:hypothetical protein